MKIDFGKVKDSNGGIIPEGKYNCTLLEVEEKTTKNGAPMWNLKWSIDGGENDGRTIYDNLVFTQAALPRLKLVCRTLGLDVSGEIDLTPGLFIGRIAAVTVVHEERKQRDGRIKTFATVPYDGYETTVPGAYNDPIESDGPMEPATVEREDLPF